MRRLALPAALTLACTLHGNGARSEDERELPVFVGVEVFDDFVATLTVDPTLPADAAIDVTVAGDGNALARLFTQVHGEGTLSVGVDPNELTELTLVPELAATVPTLTHAHAADDVTLDISGAQGELTLSAVATAKITLDDASALTLHATATDHAAVILAGAGPSLELVIEGHATVDARDFVAEKVIVRARGDGEITVCATAEITILGRGADRVTQVCG